VTAPRSGRRWGASALVVVLLDGNGDGSRLPDGRFERIPGDLVSSGGSGQHKGDD